MARITDLVDENGELLYPISTIGAIYKDNQTAEQWVEGLTNTLNTKIDTHVLEEITSENGVHGIRYYNDVLSYKNMFGEWIEITTSGGNTPTPPTPTETQLGEPTNVSLTNADESVVIMWTDPEDVDTSVWNGTVVVRKEGSVPTDKSDGTIVVDSRTRNQYATSGYTDTGLTNGTEYFYGIFPYTTNETYTNTYTTSITPSAIYPSAPTNVSVEAGDSQISISFTTPSDATGTRIVWGTSAPTDENDGDTINNVHGSFTITGLTNGTTYYVRVYSYNDKGRFTGSDVTSVTPEASVLLVPWATGTDEQIVAMVNAYYNDEITLDDIKSVWSVGDKRSVSLSAMRAMEIGVGESHRAQTVQFAIADFEHDTLTTPINGHTKATITLTQVDCLMDASNATNPTDGIHNTENGCMNNYQDTNRGGWTLCHRRTWCNNVYYNALPEIFRNSIKEVSKLTSEGNKSSTITTTSDKIWLLSDIEVFGYNYNSFSGEGSQYTYYKTTSNRYKNPKTLISDYTVSSNWWLRSPDIDYSTCFCEVDGVGDSKTTVSMSNNGIAPCLCI